MFEMKFRTDNATFAESGSYEVREVIHEVMRRMHRGETQGSCFDSNGKKIGWWSLDFPADGEEFT